MPFLSPNTWHLWSNALTLMQTIGDALPLFTLIRIVCVCGYSSYLASSCNKYNSWLLSLVKWTKTYIAFLWKKIAEITHFFWKNVTIDKTINRCSIKEYFVQMLKSKFWNWNVQKYSTNCDFFPRVHIIMILMCNFFQTILRCGKKDIRMQSDKLLHLHIVLYKFFVVVYRLLARFAFRISCKCSYKGHLEALSSFSS